MTKATVNGITYNVRQGTNGKDILIEGLGNDWIKGGGGDDTIIDLFGTNMFDGGAGSDTIIGGIGNDVFIHRMSENAGARDRYEGALGTDTLRLELTAAEWARADVQADVAAFLAHAATMKNKLLGLVGLMSDFTFRSMGLTISNIEKLEVRVDGMVMNLADEAVVARPDTLRTHEDASAAGVDLLANDSAPDRVASIQLLTQSQFGAVTLTPSLLTATQTAFLSFTPGAAMQALKAGETRTETLTYRIIDADGDVSTSKVTIVIEGRNDAAVIGTPSVAFVQEDVGVSGGKLKATGTISISDADQGEAAFKTGVTAQPGALGTLTLAANGTYTYAVDNAAVQNLGAGQTRTDSFRIETIDGTQKIVSFTIKGQNDGPTAVADIEGPVVESGVAPGVPTATGNVLSNDTDIDAGDTKTVSAVNGDAAKVGATVAGAYGNLVLQPDGSWTYTLNDAAAGTDRLAQGQTVTELFGYTMKDSRNAISSTTLAITIQGSNDAPVVSGAVAAAATEGAASLAVDLLQHASDVDSGAVLHIENLVLSGAGGPALPAGCTWSGSTLSVDPGHPAFDALAAGEQRVLTFSYDVVDEHGARTAQTAAVTITGTNDAPVAVADTGIAVEAGTATAGANATGNVLANDTDVDLGDTKAVHAVNGATEAVGSPVAGAYGTLTLLADGGYVYAVADGNAAVNALQLGQSLSESFAYTVIDAAGATATATLTLTIQGANDAPVATDDAAAVTETGVLPGTGQIAGSVIANDTDADSATLTIIAMRAGAEAGTGAAGTVGAFSFGRYGYLKLDADGGYTYALDEYNPLVNGLRTGDIVEDLFTYTVSDGHGGTDTAELRITITGRNDAPTAFDKSFNIVEDGGVSFTAQQGDYDPENDALAVTAIDGVAIAAGQTVTLANGATVTLNASGSLTYYAARDDHGQRFFDYTVSDGQGGSDVGRITMNIAPVNDAPVAQGDFNITDEETVKTGSLFADSGLGADYDVDGDSFSIYMVNGSTAAVGQVLTLTSGAKVRIDANGQFEFDPRGAFDFVPAGASSAEVVTYRIVDAHGAVSNEVTAVFSVAGINDAPVVSAAGTSVAENAAGALVATFTVGDVDTAAGLAFRVLDGGAIDPRFVVVPAAGTVAGEPGGYEIRLAAGQSFDFEAENADGDPSFTRTVEVNDGQAANNLASASFTVVVTDVPEAPTATDDHGTTLEDQAVTFTVAQLTGNDANPPGAQPLAITGVSGAVNGTVSFADGIVTFTPAAQFSGVARFDYTLANGAGTDTGTVTIDVAPVADQPTVTVPQADIRVDIEGAPGSSTSGHFYTKLPDGGLLAVWSVLREADDVREVMIQAFDSTGVARGPARDVTATTERGVEHSSAQISVLANGAIALIWSRTGGGDGDTDVLLQLVAEDGSALSPIVNVSDATDNDSNDGLSLLQQLPNGDLLVAWTNYEGAWTTPRSTLQVFDPMGNPRGEPIPVHAADEYGFVSRVVPFESGGFALFSGVRATAEANQDLFVQFFNESGSARGPAYELSTPGGENSFNDLLSRIVELEGGGIAVSWVSYNSSWSNTRLSVQIFDEDGTPRSEGIALSDVSGTVSARHEIRNFTATADGGFKVVWTRDNGAGSSRDFFLQVFDQDGTPKTPALNVSDSDGNNYASDSPVSIIDLADGGTALIWTRYYNQWNVQTFFQSFEADGTARTDVVALSPAGQSADFANYVRPLDDGGFVLISRTGSSNTENATRLQVFDGDGTPRHSAIALEDPTDASGSETIQTILSLADGGFAIVMWRRGGLDGDQDMLMRTFDADGTARGPMQNISDPTGSNGLGDQPGQSLALSDGGFVVQWTSNEGGITRVWLQIFEADGTTRTDPIRAWEPFLFEGQYEGLYTFEEIVGGFVAIGLADDGIGNTMTTVRVFDADGTTRGTFSDTRADGFLGNLVVTAEGGVALTWIGYDPNTGSQVEHTSIYSLDGLTGREDSPIAIPVAATLTDADGSENVTKLDLLGVPAGATISDGMNTTVSTGSAISILGWNLAALTFQGAQDANGRVSLTLSAEVTDSATLSNGTTATDVATFTKTFDIIVRPVNDAAVIGGVTTGSVTEGTVDAAGNLVASGQLTIADVDAGEASFLSRTDFVGDYGTFALTADGTWTYTARDDQAAIQRLGTSQSLTDSFEAVSLDGSAKQSVTVTIKGTNDAPVVVSGHMAQFTEGTGPAVPVVIDPFLTITDVDSPILRGASVTISGNYVRGEDSISLSPTSGITWQFNQVTGTLTLTGDASVAAYEALLQTVSYSNRSEHPTEGDRTFTFSVNDGSVQGAATSIVSVTGVDDVATASTRKIVFADHLATSVVIPKYLLVNDPDEISASVTAQGVTGGTASWTADSVTFTPAVPPDNVSLATAQVIERSAFGPMQNSDLGSQTLPSVSISGSLATAAEVDWYAVTLSAGETITLDIDRAYGPIYSDYWNGTTYVHYTYNGPDTNLSMYSPAGGLVSENFYSYWGNGGSGSQYNFYDGWGSQWSYDPYLQYTAPTAGKYYFSVTSEAVYSGHTWREDSRTGSYTLNVTLSGTSETSAAGSYLPEHNPDGFWGQEGTLSYLVSSDGTTTAANVAVASNYRNQSVHGTQAAELLIGTSGADTLAGNGGNDYIFGGSGSDRLSGGAGADVFFFQKGDLSGDWIQDFTRGEDQLRFAGYSDESRLELRSVSGNSWTYTMTDGASAETFTVNLELLRSDYFFI